jgi:hypothetical protein
MVIGYSLKQIATEYISATQIRFGLFLEQQNVTVDSFVLAGLSVVNDSAATITFSHPNAGFTGTGTQDAGGYDLTVSTASGAVTDSTGLIIVDVVLSSELAPSETIQLSINSLTLNGSPVNLTSANSPVITTNLLSTTIAEDSSYSFATSSHFSEVNSEAGFVYSAKVVDDAAAEITWPGWLNIDPNSGLITGTPLNEHVGSINVVVMGASTDGPLVEKAYELTITNTNDVPTLETAISDQGSLVESQEFSLDVSTHFIDVDVGDSVVYSIPVGPDWLAIDAQGVLTGTPPSGQFGTYQVTVNVTDTFSTSDTNTFASDTFELVVAAVANTEATGGVTITGTTSNGQVLTASHDITDADGLTNPTFSHQWSRLDGSDVPTEIANAVSSSYTVTDADVGYTLVDTISFMDDAGFSEAVSSAETAPIADIVKLIQVKNIQSLTASQASIEINGVDRTSGSQEKIVKFDIYLDAQGIELLDVNAFEILGAQMDLNLDNSLFENVGSFASSSDTSYMMDVVSTLSPTVNKETGGIAVASSSAIVDTDTNNDTDWPPIGVEIKIATIYVNPIDESQALTLGLENMTIDANGITIQPHGYEIVIPANASATITTDVGHALTDTTLEFYSDGVSTGVSKIITNGQIEIDQSLTFDVVKLADPSIYTADINISDAVQVLQHIVNLTDLEANARSAHAADVNNDEEINISDVVSILKHIVNLDTIDTFDLVSDSGVRITQLDASQSNDVTWDLVANGDVNGGGTFDAINLFDII